MYYTGDERGGPDTLTRTWLTADRGHSFDVALRSGQLEIVDASAVHASTGGKPTAMSSTQHDAVTRGLEQGYPGVAVTADSAASRIMVPDPDERRDMQCILAADASLPVRALCQYDVRTEDPGRLAEIAGTNYRSIVDPTWSASEHDGRWWVRGEIDDLCSGRYAAAPGAVITGPVRGSRADPHHRWCRFRYRRSCDRAPRNRA